MFSRITRTPATLIVLVIVVAILAGWLGLLIFGPDDPSHHAAASDATASMVDHEHAGPPGSVADRLRTEEQAVGFCVSAALEPFAGAVAQIREIGPAETGERFRRCLLDTMFDHASEQTLAEIELHREHFTNCFGELATHDETDKAVAVDDTRSCVQRTTESSRNSTN